MFVCVSVSGELHKYKVSPEYGPSAFVMRQCICHALYITYALNIVGIDGQLAHVTWNAQVMDCLRVLNSLEHLSCTR